MYNTEEPKSFDYDKIKLSCFELAKNGDTEAAMNFLDLAMHAQKLEEKLATKSTVGRPRGPRKASTVTTSEDTADSE